MKTPSVPRDRALSQVAERQMRTWSLGLQEQQRVAEHKAATPVPGLIKPYLAISRETGAGGSELAHTIAAKCGWKTLDRELLDYIAEHEHFSRLAIDLVDEKAASWFHEIFGKWLDAHILSQAEYVSRMGRVVLLAAQHESTVFVGRGAQFILPREAGLAVRIIATKKMRAERIMELKQCSRLEAEQFVDQTDQDRAEFVRRYFHRDVADPHLYDLVINLERISREDAAELIVLECQRRFAKG
ncbi:MAG: cytidylate kinase-like family protein [Planctomycetes bacterium]|nr:cytidylate kinase-like family protein [Planctomycetota bacterium]